MAHNWTSRIRKLGIVEAWRCTICNGVIHSDGKPSPDLKIYYAVQDEPNPKLMTCDEATISSVMVD